MGYPALVERALRLVEAKGGRAAESELCQELFGGTGGPWARMLGQVLATDGRLKRSAGGDWLSGRAIADAPARFDAGGVSGLVVLAAGPKPWKHPIVAIGAARDGARFETLVRPGQPCRVPAFLARLGVRAEELDEAPPLDGALVRLLDFVGRGRLVGLDVGVAVARLQFALRAIGHPPLDNAMTELAIADGVKPDLTALARARGLPLPSRLSAGALAELALRLDPAGAHSDDTPGEVSGHAVGSALDSTAWRRLLDARVLSAIPSLPGVYLFLDRVGRLLYVGKATSLRARLASYLTGQFALVRSMPGLVEATDQLEHEPLSCELAARIREAELIAEYRPTYNVQRRLEPALAWVGLELAGSSDDAAAPVPRLRLREGRAPFAGAELAPVVAARAAFRRARAGWFPARSRRDARPSPAAASERFARLAQQFAAELRAAPIAPGLTAADLAAGLRVMAPIRPQRPATAEHEGDAFTRERFDANWPPRELLDVVDASHIEATDASDAFAPDTLAEVVVAPARLVALSVVLAALRRAEPGVSAAPA